MASELLRGHYMELPLQITYRNMESSTVIDRAIREHMKRLEGVCQDITGCRIMVEAPHQHQRRGQLYHVRIDITVPGAELVVGRHPRKCEAHRDFHVALRDAFRAARRELKNYAQRRRSEVKHHELPRRALVTQIFWGQDYGFLQARDGRSVYFHANSVVGGLEALEVGAIVEYTEAAGNNGPQATRLKRVGRNHSHVSGS